MNIPSSGPAKWRHLDTDLFFRKGYTGRQQLYKELYKADAGDTPDNNRFMVQGKKKIWGHTNFTVTPLYFSEYCSITSCIEPLDGAAIFRGFPLAERCPA